MSQAEEKYIDFYIEFHTSCSLTPKNVIFKKYVNLLFLIQKISIEI